jgi:acyl dehydratase
VSDYYFRDIPLAELKAQEGSEIGVSSWFDITQERITAFAEITEDTFFIHIDPERAARETPYGGTIAHGFLTASLLSAMAYDALPRIRDAARSVNYGFNRLRFITPVCAGSRIRGRFMLTRADDTKPGEVTLEYAVTVEIEGVERPALAAEWLSRHFFDGA